MKPTDHMPAISAAAASTAVRPLVMVTNHEPLMFRRRTGLLAADAAAEYAREHAEETVRALAALGITWHRTHFFKGFGLRAEREEIERTKDFVKLCHRYGIKVELYIQWGTLQYETFLDECPEMPDWCVVTEEGQYAGITYGHQCFRYRPCTTRPGFWDYLRRVIDVALDEVQADGLGFDNVANTLEPESCHCPECRRAFVAFLKEKYDVATDAGRRLATERFGFAVLEHVRPPTFNRWNPAHACRLIRDPVMQEWMDFRCAGHLRRMREVWEHVKARAPRTVVEHNLYPGMGMNNAWWAGTSLQAELPYLDAFWDEMSPPLSFRRGALMHRAHAMKLAESAGRLVYSDVRPGTPGRQQRAVAEGLMFNQGNPGVFGGPLSFLAGAYAPGRKMIAFRQAHDALFAETTSAAQIVIFVSERGQRLNLVEPWHAEVLAFQSLLAGHVPFRLATTLDHDSLPAGAVLLLLDAECLSDEEAARITAHVRQGGGLVVTGATGHFDLWHRPRAKPALATVFAGVADGSGAPRRTTCGRGRAVWLPRLEPVTPFAHDSTDWAILPKYWQVPKNHAAFLKAVAWAAAGRLAVEVTAPPGVAAEWRRAADGRYLLHLLDYDTERRTVTVRAVVRGVEIRSARLWTPERGQSRMVRIADGGRGGTQLFIGAVPGYGIVEIVAAGENTKGKGGRAKATVRDGLRGGAAEGAARKRGGNKAAGVPQASG